MIQPKISVVTVCYNAVNDIEKTILSVINQTYPNIEYLIIDGGSTDGTMDVVNRYKDKIDVIVSEPDNGIYDAMNKGVEKSHNKEGYVNFLNAGDTYYSNKTLELVFNIVKESDDFLCGIAKYPNGRYWCPISKKQANIANMFRGGNANHQSTFLKVSMLQKFPYNIKYKIVEDDLYLIKKVCIERKKYQAIPLIVANYNTNGISNSIEYEKKKYDERISFLREYCPKYLNKLYKNKRYRICEILRKSIQMLYVILFVEAKSK